MLGLRWRTFGVACFSAAVGALAATLATLYLNRPDPPERRLSADAEAIKRLIPAAAGIPESEWDGLRWHTAEPLLTWLRGYSNLESELAYWPEDLDVVALSLQDIELAMIIERATIRDGLVSLVHLDYIDDYVCGIVNDSASGRFTYSAEGLWRGRADFLAAKGPDGWVITAFRFPARDVILALRADGSWRPVATELMDRSGPPPDRLVVNLMPEGRIRMMRRNVDFDDLSEVMRSRAMCSQHDVLNRPMLALLIVPHPASSYETLAGVLQLCVEMRINQVSLRVHGREFKIDAALSAPGDADISLALEEAAKTGNAPVAGASISLAGKPCADLDELTDKLRELKWQGGNPRVCIEADPGVPALWVFDVLCACRAIETPYRLALP